MVRRLAIDLRQVPRNHGFWESVVDHKMYSQCIEAFGVTPCAQCDGATTVTRAADNLHRLEPALLMHLAVNPHRRATIAEIAAAFDTWWRWFSARRFPHAHGTPREVLGNISEVLDGTL
jgi:hypothetical protein